MILQMDTHVLLPRFTAYRHPCGASSVRDGLYAWTRVGVPWFRKEVEAGGASRGGAAGVRALPGLAPPSLAPCGLDEKTRWLLIVRCAFRKILLPAPALKPMLALK